jgi:hypothetical protein
MKGLNDNTRPVSERKLRQIRVSVFKNEGKDGSPYFNTPLVRRYQSGENKWSNSSHFTGKANQILVRQLIDEVLNFISSEEAGDGVA